MEPFLDKILAWSFTIRHFMWGNWMMGLLVATGVILTIVTGVIQIRKFIPSFRLIFRGAVGKDHDEDDEGDISPFAALMTALAATVGNGNIAGIATAIALGGPGAPFWMWLSGFFGMATKYAEGFLGVKYREVAEDGSMAGGPMYYCLHGIRNKKLGRILGAAFAILGGYAALFGTGNMAQSNSMTLALKRALIEHVHFFQGISENVIAFWIGLSITVLVGAVILGGIKRIGAVAGRLVPIMILVYFLGAVTIILFNFEKIPEAFAIIFKYAFSVKAVGGAVVGRTIQRTISHGISKGVLSNEAGLGSAAIAQSASRSSDPVKNGLIAMSGVFIDTIFVNTLTTLTIVITGVWLRTPYCGKALGAGGITSTELTASAWATVIPGGEWIIAGCSFLFGYTTLIAWSYYGEQCAEYLWGLKVVKPYRLAFILLTFIGAMLQGRYLDIVWNIGDLSNAFMAFPNLVGLLLLAGIVARTTRERFRDSRPL